MDKSRVDVKAVESFYQFLAHTRFTEVRLLHEERKPKVFFVKSSQGLVEICKSYNGKYNLYAGISERRTNQHPGKADDVCSVKTICLDIDAVKPREYPASEEELKEAEKVADKIISDFSRKGFEKPVKVLSGSGYQLFFAIPAIRLDGYNRYCVEGKIKEFNRRIANKYQTDKAKIDQIGNLSRIIRIWGCLNVKGRNLADRPHRVCYPVTDPVRREDKRLYRYLEKVELREPKKVEKRSKVPEKLRVLLEGDEKLKDLYFGVWEKYGYPSRSEAEQALCVKLALYNFSEDEISSIMESSLIGKWQSASECYKEVTLRKALEFAGG